MVCKSYVAVTAKEMSNLQGQNLAWMACRFDPKGKGLTNLPEQLPAGSLILVDDLHPLGQHDLSFICRQLRQLCQRLQCAGIVLDLQRPKSSRSLQMVNALLQLPIPVAVTGEYARNLNCPVFLTAPMHIKLQKLLAPWNGREVWLDVPMGLKILHQGKIIEETATPQSNYQWDRFLCCGYVRHSPDRFTLCRSKQMLPKILDEAARLGIPKALVLHSEL